MGNVDPVLVPDVEADPPPREAVSPAAGDVVLQAALDQVVQQAPDRGLGSHIWERRPDLAAYASRNAEWLAKKVAGVHDFHMTSPVVDHGPASEAVEVESPDQTITRTTKVLLAHHGLKPPMLEELILGLKKSTVYRRFDEGGWSASEVAALAALFNVPVGAFNGGRWSDRDTSGQTLSRYSEMPKIMGGPSPAERAITAASVPAAIIRSR